MTRSGSSAVGILAFLFAIFALPALAHHGWSSYDAEQTLKLTGTIKDAGYEHPHGYIKLQTKDKEWLAILAPPIACKIVGCRARD